MNDEAAAISEMKKLLFWFPEKVNLKAKYDTISLHPQSREKGVALMTDQTVFGQHYWGDNRDSHSV